MELADKMSFIPKINFNIESFYKKNNDFDKPINKIAFSGHSKQDDKINVSSQNTQQAYYPYIPKTGRVKETQISIQLQEEMRSAIRNIYGKNKEEEVFENVLKIVKSARAERSFELKKEDYSRPADWYKKEVIYMFYPDQFGVNGKNKPNQFKDLPKMFDYIKDFGATTLYITPFFDSPMGDGGFDVSNLKDVRKDLGGISQFDKFLTKARNKGLKIQADLVLNHVSDQHDWFTKALSGDKKYLDYFIHTDKLPEFKRYTDKQKGVVVDYQEGKAQSKRRLMFPTASEHHYEKHMVNGKKEYFYHTFYPFQPDLNWKNPELMYEVLDTCKFWANKGIDVFRLDALPFYVKEKGTSGENLKKTHEIVKLVSSFIQATAPRSVLIAEACMWPKDIRPYFGEDRIVQISKNKEIERTNKMQMAYNFPYMPAMWSSVLTEDAGHFWKAYNKTPEIPESAAWSIFSRCHDELTLEMVDIKTRKNIYDKLVPKGAKFREGLGVGGRLANFLDNDPKKIGLLNSVMFSLPGVPVVYYGDEIGANNNWDYAKECAKNRQGFKLKNDSAQEPLDESKIVESEFFDSREINRGPINSKDFYKISNDSQNPKHEIYENIKNLINARKQNPAMTDGKLIKVDTSKNNVFSFIKKGKAQEILVLNNLSDKASSVKINLPEEAVQKITGSKTLFNLLTKKEKQITTNIQDNKHQLQIELEPYESAWLSF